MKRVYKSLFVVTALFTVSFIHSCKKHVDCKIEDLRLCSIKRVILLGTYENDTATFYYNALGNPTKMLVTNVHTGNPNYEFKYDALNRLSQFIGVYENGFTANWVMYTYGAGGRITVDTTYTFAAYNGGTYPTDYWGKRINRYTYDAAGRISRIDTEQLLPAAAPTSTTYNYDGDGNLIRPGVVYDDKINFHRTHSIWQFVDRDYSQNNPMTAVTYNPYLPLQFRGPAAPINSFLHFPINQSDFIYNCTLPPVKLPKGVL